MIHVLYLENNPEHIKLFIQQATTHDLSVATAGTLKEALIRYQQKQAQLICVGTQFPPCAIQSLYERWAHNSAHFYRTTPLASASSSPKSYRLHVFIQKIKHDYEASNSTTKQRQAKYDFYGFIGRSKAMLKLYDEISKVAPTEVPVLLIGESGSGKELAAKAIHQHSLRHQNTYLPINCAAISAQIIESELFGHEKGSFTGAEKDRQGYFANTHQGTLFLDEITEMPMSAQTKLLRVLEQGEYLRVGSNIIFHCDTRIIAATNRNPLQAIQEQRLREDLYYRLNVFPIYLPPLRERGEDIELLARTLLENINQEHGTQKQLSRISLQHLTQYDWPGNVRELHNALLRAYILSEKREIDLFPELEREA